MKYVHISANVTNRIKTLRKAGKAGAALAHKASRIIENLTSGYLRHHMDGISGYTKYGEKRIKDCRKYDMGCGYRLITLQRGQRVFIPFLGTHDECQRWLESNSRLKSFTAGKGTWFRVSREQRLLEDQARATSSYQREDACEASELKVSDEDLRRVFSGLVEAANRRRPKP